MNLTTDPWIPVVNAAGNTARLSLRQVFAEGQHWQDFALRPHERVALMRLLICVAQAALKGPMSSQDGVLEELPAKADAYLIEWHDSFDLFHPTKPFLQFGGLVKVPRAAKKSATGKVAPVATEEEDATSVSKLDFALATGNNTTLFDHAAATTEDRIFSSSELALMLITFQCFSPSGRIGVAQWGQAETPGKGSSGHSPCCPSSMLHAFVRKGSIVATVVANLLTYDVVNLLYRHDGWGLPVWEQLPESFLDTDAVVNATQTYLGRLMPLSRALLLKSEGLSVVLANGLDYPTAPDFPPEPTATQVTKRDGTGRVLVGAGSRAIWRELPSIMIQRQAGQPGGPLVLSQLSDTEPFDLWVGALMTDKASILDTVEGVYSVPAKMLRSEGRVAYEAEVTYADQKVRYALSEGAKTYRQCLELKPQGYPEQTAALRHYWNAVERLLPLLNAYIVAKDGSPDQQERRKTWRSSLWKAARSAYEASCAFETPRQRRAYPLGLRSLQFIQRKKDEPTTQATQAV